MELIFLIDQVVKEKYLTSIFAKESSSILAINGEAGETPRLGSGFGEWIGNWISKGTPIFMMDTDKRPFLSFDNQNVARYYKAEIVDKEVTSEKYNTIWGRMDLLEEGVFHTNLSNDRQPRTIMGIDSTGTKLYLICLLYTSPSPRDA